MTTGVEDYQIVQSIVFVGEVRNPLLQARLRLFRLYLEGFSGIVKSLFEYALKAFDLGPKISGCYNHGYSLG